MGKWKMARLKDILEDTITGEWGTECLQEETGVKVLRTTNFTNTGIIDYSNVVLRNISSQKITAKKLKMTDIILEKSGGSDNQPVGRVVFFENKDDTYLCNNFTQILRVNINIAFPKYVFFYLFNLHKNGTTELLQNKTTGIRNLQTKSYLEQKVPLPPLDVQKKIAEVLDKASALIELRKAQLEKLDLLIKSQFIEMFGDVQNNSKGWPKEALGSHIDIITGYPFDSSGYTENGIKICGGLIIMPGTIEWDVSKHWPSVEGYEEYLLQDKDIVVALDRPWISSGFKIAQINVRDLPALLIQRTARIRGVDINQEFLFWLLKDKAFEMHCTVTGSLVPHISHKDIKSYSVIIPPEAIQELFANFVQKVNKSKFVLQQSLEKLELNYKSLMQKCFRGEIF